MDLERVAVATEDVHSGHVEVGVAVDQGLVQETQWMER